MRQALKPHPDSPCAAAIAIEGGATRSCEGALLLSYEVIGPIGDLRLPPIVAQTRADELWRRTCFEAFVRPAAGVGYFEFNFAPSRQWAAYRFDGDRSGMRAAEIGPPRIDVECTPVRFTLRATLTFDALPSDPWRLGLSAVIEETSGRLSYWALAHPAGKPDFHHADCFTCEI